MKIQLYLRVVLSDRTRTFAKPVISGNGKLKPYYALVDGKPEHHPESVYYLRYAKNGKRVFENVGTDAATAWNIRLKREKALEALAVGLVISEEHPPENQLAAELKPRLGGRPLNVAIAEYLSEIKLTKKPKTLTAYTIALRYFRESCVKPTLEEIERRDMLLFHVFLRDKKHQSPRSCWNKFSNVMSFLKTYKIRELVRKGDWPVFVEEEPQIYEPAELDRFFAACDEEERVWFEFFTMTGMREQEVMHTAWRNVNWAQGTVSVTWKSEYQWMPKMYREREIPVPTKLLNSLKAFRPEFPSGLIFPTEGGRPKLDFLDCCKAVAKRAGFNPDDFWLHKYRATFATMHLQAGVDIRTVQMWCGHTDLESTLRYLKPARGASVRQKVNNTFSMFEI